MNNDQNKEQESKELTNENKSIPNEKNEEEKALNNDDRKEDHDKGNLKEYERYCKMLKENSMTDYDQFKTENMIRNIFETHEFKTAFAEDFKTDMIYENEKHYNYAKKHIFSLPEGYKSSENGMAWFSYFILNILEMCKTDYELSKTTKLYFVDMLKELQHSDGGFSGAPRGTAHLVCSYAAMLSIMNLGIEEAYDIIDIPKMRSFLLRMKNSNYDNKHPSMIDSKGGFLIRKDIPEKGSSYQIAWPGCFMSQYNGESDLRATYCALVIASILDILDDEIKEGVVENIKKCQTFEGGIGPEPFCEAHGGYSFCGIASLIILDELHAIDVDSFLRWLVNRQMTVEGGFNGRTNKLVDSCYSFWQGSVFNLLYMGDKKYTYDQELLYDQLSLQAYIILCCQIQNGGLVDKPGKKPDLFHTNYASAGMLCSQKCMLDKCEVSLTDNNQVLHKKINPVYSVLESKVTKAQKYYKILKLKQSQLKEEESAIQPKDEIIS